MKSFGKTLSYGVSGLAFALATGVFRLLPVRWASAVGGRIFRVLGPHLGINRLALRNMGRAFPDWSEGQRMETLSGMWENLGRVLGEYPHLKALETGRAGWVEVIEDEHFKTLRQQPGPALILAAHMANWELVETLHARYGMEVAYVYREPNNPFVARILRRFRGPYGFAKGRRGAAQLMAWLASGKKAILLVDQKMNDGLPVPFFGHDAMTAPAIANLAHRFKCPIYSMEITRTSGTDFCIQIGAPMHVDSDKPRAQVAPHVMAKVNAVVEGWVRAHPEQWLWLHRRWPD